MKIAQVHNFYQQSGGEDTVVFNEKNLLEENGHQVIPFYKSNSSIPELPIHKKVGLIKSTSYSTKSYTEFKDFLIKNKPDICHVHNTLPLITPSIYKACNDLNIPVIQTLHNYRLICVNGLFLRNGTVCEDCLCKSPKAGVKNKCYRNSHIQSYAVAKMLVKSRKSNVWSEKIDRYLCLTPFARSKFIKHGLPESKLFIKPNFTKELAPTSKKDGSLLFVGRLETEKGIELIIELAKQTDNKIKVIGSGKFSAQIQALENIEYLGQLTNEETIKQIQKAKLLLFPSVWYEGMPMTILEAFSAKTAVLASDLGAMASLIEHNKTGYLFNPNSVSDFSAQIEKALSSDEKREIIAQNGHKEFENKFNKSSNYNLLISNYREVIANYN